MSRRWRTRRFGFRLLPQLAAKQAGGHQRRAHPPKCCRLRRRQQGRLERPDQRLPLRIAEGIDEDRRVGSRLACVRTVAVILENGPNRQLHRLSKCGRVDHSQIVHGKISDPILAPVGPLVAEEQLGTIERLKSLPRLADAGFEKGNKITSAELWATYGEGGSVHAE